MLPISDGEKRRLCVEIFELTGQKVDAEDPIIVAALFYSEKLRRVSLDHQLAINSVLLQAEEALENTAQAAVKLVEQASRRSADSAKVEVTTLAKKAIADELPGLRLSMERLVKSMIEKLSNGRHSSAPTLSAGMLTGCAALIAAAGVAAGVLWANPTKVVSADDAKALAIGRATLAIYSSLDAPARERLTTDIGRGRHDQQR